MGIVADFSYNWKSNIVDISIGSQTMSVIEKNTNLFALFGPQFYFPQKNGLTPFCRILCGAGRIQLPTVYVTMPPEVNTEKITNLACGFGGGLDLKIGRRLDLRLIQIDYIRQTGPQIMKGNLLRIGAGMVFKAR